MVQRWEADGRTQNDSGAWDSSRNLPTLVSSVYC